MASRLQYQIILKVEAFDSTCTSELLKSNQ